MISAHIICMQEIPGLHALVNSQLYNLAHNSSNGCLSIVLWLISFPFWIFPITTHNILNTSYTQQHKNSAIQR